ncbi:MAG: hypothetical protein ACRDNW_20220 [Trebonia sp.]
MIEDEQRADLAPARRALGKLLEVGEIRPGDRIDQRAPERLVLPRPVSAYSRTVESPGNTASAVGTSQ